MASVNQTQPHCVNQMGKTHSKPSAARHGRGTAWARDAMCELAWSWWSVLWVPFHVRLEGKEIADKLSKKGIALHTKETPSQADTLKKPPNHKIAKKYKQDANELGTTKKWRDVHKIWAEYKDKPRKEAVANFRLKTGHDCLAAHVRKIGIYESRECTICQMPNSTMDEEHLLRCPKLDTDWQVFKNTIKLYWDARAMMR